ncbi:MAG TPA: hypothetical protein VEB65_11525 [Solirubrobacterales bacterium]|nr:hypothetical protein [Solirubrobacterales bacterium]
MFRRPTGLARLAGPVGAVLVLAACLGLAPAAGAGATERRHVPEFDLLVRPTTVSKLPAGLRLGFEGFGEHHRHKHGRTVRVGQVRLAEGTVTAAGNHRWVCIDFTPKGERRFSGGGGCAPYAQTVRDGLVNICADAGGKLQIDGLVPNGVTAIELDRDGPAPARTVPVVRNAFSAPLPRAGLSFRALNSSGEAVIEHRYPLAHTIGEGGGGCYAFFEAVAESPRSLSLVRRTAPSSAAARPSATDRPPLEPEAGIAV